MPRPPLSAFPSRRAIKLSAVLASAALLALGVLAAPPANADSAAPDYPLEPYVDEYGHLFDPAYPFVDVEEQDLTTEPPVTSPDGVESRNVVIQANPYGCRGLTENVHGSGSFASLHARTWNCSAAPSQIQVSAEIVKLGYLGVWHSLGATPKENFSGTATSIDSNRKLICSDQSFQTYRGNGHHRVRINGTNYYASTSSDVETRFSCNAHRP